MIKMTISQYCASGFYGEGNCRCKKCCELQGREYSPIDEHRDWIYSQVMRGESFIVKGAKVLKTWSDDNGLHCNTDEVDLYYYSKERPKKEKTHEQ